MFEGEGASPPSAPSIRVINYSIGDRFHQFDRGMSSLARLMDWLSWKYRVLFIVSAGNHADSLDLQLPRGTLAAIEDEDLAREVLKSVLRSSWSRRLRVPAESINAITVGAAHTDSSTAISHPDRIDPYKLHMFASPISALGFGYRRSVKPDVLNSGGRQMFRTDLTTGSTTERLVCVRGDTSRAPGHRVATPTGTPGSLKSTCFIRGTSNATALTTRLAAQIYELVSSMPVGVDGATIDSDHVAVAIKTLIVHSANWTQVHSAVEAVIREVLPQVNPRDALSRLFGYGQVDDQRVIGCTDQRVTLIGTGALASDEGHIYSIPLPPGLNAYSDWKRVTITLAWLSPVSPESKTYRDAALWFELQGNDLGLRRTDAQWQAVRRGTVQHEVFFGDKAVAIVDGDTFTVRVNCRSDRSDKRLPMIPYGIAVTIEVAQESSIAIYSEVATRIRSRVPLKV